MSGSKRRRLQHPSDGAVKLRRTEPARRVTRSEICPHESGGAAKKDETTGGVSCLAAILTSLKIR